MEGMAIKINAKWWRMDLFLIPYKVESCLVQSSSDLKFGKLGLDNFVIGNSNGL